MSNVSAQNQAAICLVQKAGLPQGGRAICVWCNKDTQKFTIRVVEFRAGLPGNHWTMETVRSLQGLGRDLAHRWLKVLSPAGKGVPVLLDGDNTEGARFRRSWMLADSDLNYLDGEVEYNPT